MKRPERLQFAVSRLPLAMEVRNEPSRLIILETSNSDAKIRACKKSLEGAFSLPEGLRWRFQGSHLPVMQTRAA